MKNKAAVTLGALGGKARARNLSKAKLQEIARAGGLASAKARKASERGKMNRYANPAEGFRVLYKPEWFRATPYCLFNNVGGMVGHYKTQKQANAAIPTTKCKSGD